jgi:F0F1-type ATP synthase membrane subunit c/vacuolar-type H+-ATPase subunit K
MLGYLAVPLFAFPIGTQKSPLFLALIWGFLALSALGAAMIFRNRLIQPASETLRSNPEDKSAAAQWQRGVILSLVFCETVAILGFALRLTGGPWNICGIFYAIGMFFLLAWWPRLELPPN